jgi:Acetyltransferase (GNAT) family.
MKIRTATIEDAAAISQLVYSLSAKYITIDFNHEGARNLLASMEATAIEGYLRSGFRYHIAEENGIVLGVIGVRENKYLYHLFVTEARQKQGLATRLWRVAREACIAAGNPGEFTVNSSRFALPFYRKLGFVQVGAPESRGGV